MNGYVKYFNHNKSVNLLVHNKELLKKYNEIWDKISNLLKKGFDSKPVYNDKCIKTKIKIYIHRININFQCNKIPEDNYLIIIIKQKMFICIIIRFCHWNR